jgi:hypothetical protein
VCDEADGTELDLLNFPVCLRKGELLRRDSRFDENTQGGSPFAGQERSRSLYPSASVDRYVALSYRPKDDTTSSGTFSPGSEAS